MPGKKTWAILAVLAATGVVAWAVLRESDGSRGPGAPSQPPRPPDGSAAAPTLRGAGEAPKPPEPGEPGRISGWTVRDRVPVRATVALHRVERPERRRTDDEWLARDFDAPRLPGAPAAVVETDENGRFAFESLAPGSYALDARDAEGRRARDPVDLDSREDEEVRLDLTEWTETLRGRVLRGDGTGWRGLVAVCADGAWSNAYLLTETDGDGRFVATGLPRERVMIRAIRPGVAHATTWVDLPHAEEIVLAFGGGEVHGRVLDDEARPVAGALVVAVVFEKKPLLTNQRATTDGEGRFSLDLFADVPPLEVRAPGHAPFSGRPTRAADGAAEVRLQRWGRLRGRAVDARTGTGAPSVRIRAYPTDEYLWTVRAQEVTSGPDGAFVVEELAPEKTLISARGGGWALRPRTRGREMDPRAIEVEIRPGQAAEVLLSVVPAARVRGRIVDANGRPVPFAPISWTARRDEGGAIWRESRDRATSDGEGRFTAGDLVPGLPYELVATADGHAATGFGPRVFSEGEDVEIEMRFPPARFVEVMVFRSDTGGPLPFAEVRASVDEERTPVWHRVEQVAGPDGRVRLGPLPEGDLEVSATADGFLGSESAAIGDRSDPPGAEPVVLRVEPVHVLEGRVLAPDGTAPDGVLVEARLLGDEDRSGGYGRAFTDPEGRFRIEDLAAGRFVVRAWIEEGLDTIAAGEVEASADSKDVVLRLAPKVEESANLPDALVVRVLGPDGSPVPRASARLVWGTHDYADGRVRDGEGVLVDEDTERDADAWLDVSAATDAAGRALPLAHARVGPIPPSQREIEVRLEPERPLAGRVLDPEGRGIAGARIELRVPGPPPRAHRSPAEGGSVVSGPEGEFSFPGLGDLEYVLRVLPPDEFVLPGEVRVRGGDRGVALRLERGVRLRITVLDHRGKPVAGAGVTAFPPGDLDDPEWRDRARRQVAVRAGEYEVRHTDGEGKVLAPAVDPRWVLDVAVVPPPERPDLCSTRLLAWRPSDTTIRLEAGGRVAGTLRDPKGEPVSDGVHARGADGSEYVEWTGDDGRFLFEDLPAGEAVLSATSHGHGEEVTVRVPVGTKDAVLVVDPGASFTVQVGDTPKVGTQRIAVYLTGAFGVEEGRLDENARAEFEGLPPETAFDVFVGPTSDGRFGLERGLRVADAAVLVVLEEGRTLRGRVRAPAGTEGIEAHVEVLGIEVPCALDAEGRFVRRGLPPGRWTVVASGRREGRRLSASAEAAADGYVELDLAE